MNRPIISVITPVFNKWELTEQCLKSLHRYTPKGIAEYIFINNASTDQTAEYLDSLGKELFGDYFTGIHCSKNINFGPASNLGAEHAKADLLFFLNNDTVATQGWYLPLLQHAQQDNNFGAVGPLLLYPDNTVQHLGVTFSMVHMSHLYADFPKHHPFIQKKRRLHAITGAALLTTKQTFNSIGGFFPAYANGYEDLDLCHQIIKNNLSISCEPKSIIYHLESQSHGRHQQDSANSSIFTERVFPELCADLHHHALRDGLDVGLTDKFDIFIKLTKEESLTLQSTVTTTEQLRLTLAENPLWLEGYIKLAEQLDVEGLQGEACDYWERALRINLTKDLCFKMQSSALASHDLPLANTIHKIIEDINIKQRNSINILQSILKKAYMHNDQFLINLYEKELFKHKKANR